MRLRLVAAIAALLTVFGAAKADTLSSVTSGTSTLGSTYVAQSFTVSGTGSYDDISISLYKQFWFWQTPYASGTAYLFSAPYTGSASGLASATANLLGSAAASSNAYTFASTLTLTAGTTYYFYVDTALSGLLGNTAAAGGGRCDSPSTTASLDFTVSGDPFSPAPPTPPVTTATPEPSSLLLLGTGLLGVAGAARRRLLA